MPRPQGTQAMVTVDPQIRGNVPLYSQQRFEEQMRQTSVPSTQAQPQKLPGQSSSAIASMNPQLSVLTPNCQSVLLQNTLSQRQWMKQMQPTMLGSLSPSYLQQQQHQRQQHAFMQQQLSMSQQQPKSLGLTQQQISQFVQQSQQGAAKLPQPLQKQFHQQQLQKLQQQLQQQSPIMQEQAVQQSLSLIGSHPDTPPSGTTPTSGNSSQGNEASIQLLGKRKIQDLVSQVDSLA